MPALSPSLALFLPRLRLKFCAVSFAFPSSFFLFLLFLSRVSATLFQRAAVRNLYRIPVEINQTESRAREIGIELTWVADSWRRVPLHNRHVSLFSLFFSFFFFFVFSAAHFGVASSLKYCHAPFHSVTRPNRLTPIPNLSAVIISVRASFTCVSMHSVRFYSKINSVIFVRSDVLRYIKCHNLFFLKLLLSFRGAKK